MKTIKKVSFKEAELSDNKYWKSKSPEEKLDTLQYLREIFYEFKNEDRKNFQRVYRIIKQQ
jgi:predicted solute-binding protein